MVLLSAVDIKENYILKLGFWQISKLRQGLHFA